MRERWSAAFSALVLAVSLSGCNVIPGHEPRETYLTAVFPRMVVEIDYQTGKTPRDEAVNLLKQRILERCHKPDGVQVDLKAIEASDNSWTPEELRALEKKNRDRRTGGTTAALYIVYLGGGYHTDTPEGRVIGVRYTLTSIAIFRDTLESAANPVGINIPLFTASDLEKSVLVHEFGHAVGLVNLETPMVTPHEDPDPNHRGHSNNKDSVMYWAIESSAISRFFNGPPPTDFDANDKADLRNAGGK